jgi:hypothetical protein
MEYNERISVATVSAEEFRKKESYILELETRM